MCLVLSLELDLDLGRASRRTVSLRPLCPCLPFHGLDGVFTDT